MSKYIEVGKLNKTFGTRGQIKVSSPEGYLDDLEQSDVWFVDSGAGEVPYFVESINKSVHFLVKFEDINSPEDARKITGNAIKLRGRDVTVVEQPADDLQALSGFQIFDHDEHLVGVIEKIEEYPQQLMAFVDCGDHQVMIPLVEEYIDTIEMHEQRIVMSLPDGLVDG